uniref:Uncharacterized protein n=1 Tax=Triticum urartu TaxID=4572 RepID=A0A8R7P4S6_TRIUA
MRVEQHHYKMWRIGGSRVKKCPRLAQPSFLEAEQHDIATDKMEEGKGVEERGIYHFAQRQRCVRGIHLPPEPHMQLIVQ